MPQTRRSCAEELEQSRKLDKSTGLSPGREGKSILKPCRQRMPLQEVSDLQFNGDKDGDANELCRNSSRRVSFAVSEVKEFVQPVNEGTLWGNLYVYDIQKSSSESEATTPSCSDLPNVSSASYKSGFVMSQEIVVEETVSVSYSQDVSEDKRQEILHQNHGVRRNLFVDRGNQTDESSFHILGESQNEHQGKCHCNTREIQERNCIEDFVCSYALRSRKSTKLCDEYINNTCSNSHVYQLKRKHSPSQNSDHGDGDDKDDCKASFGVDHKVKKKRRHKNKGNKCGPNSLQNQPSKEENKQVDPTNTESRHFPDCHVIRNECFKIVECNATSSSDSEGDAYRGSLAQNTSFCNREMRDEKNCHMLCQSPSKIDCSGSSMETDSFLSYSIKEENLHCKEEYRTKSHVEPTENILNGSQDEDMSFTLAEGLVLSDLSEGKSSVCTDDKKVDFVDQGKIHSEAREQNTSHTQYFNENVNNTTNIQSCSDNVSVCTSPTLAVGKILGSINQEFRSSNAGFSPTIAVGQIFKIETEKSHEIKGILSPISVDKKIILNDSIKSYKVEDKGMCPSFGDSNTANENMELTSADISDDTSSITRGVIFSENHCSENNHFIHTMINSPTKNCEVSTPSSMFRSIFNPKTMFMCNTFQKYKETEEHNCSTYMSNDDDDDDDDDSKPCIKNCGSGAEGKSECNTIDNISKPALIKEDSVCNDLQDTSKRKSEFSEPSNHPDEVLSVRESPKHLLATTVNHSGSNFSDSEQCMQFNISERSVSPIVAAGKIFGPANASTKFSNNVSELITSAESDDKCSKSEESMQMDNSEGSLSPTTADGKIFSSVSGLMNIIDSSKTRISKKLCENICSKSEQFVLMGTSGRCVSPTIAAGKIISSESRSDENINNYPRQTICANVTENVLSKSEKVEGNISMCNISHTIPAGKILSSDIIQKIGFVNSSILSTSALLPEDLLSSKFEKPMDMDNSAGRNVSPTMAAGKIFTAENGQDGVNSFIQTTSAKFSANTLPSRFEKPMEMDISGRNLSPTIAAGKILTSEIGKEYDLVNSSMLSANAEFSTHTLSSRFEKPVQMDISGRSVSPTMAAGKIFTSENGKENDLNPSIQTKSSICSVHTLPSRFEKPLEMNVSGRSVSPTLAAGKNLTSENGEENDLNPSIQTKSSICSVHTLPSRFEKPMEINVSARSVSPTLAAGKILTSENGKENDLNPSIQTKSSICSVHTLPSRFEKPMEINVSARSVSPTLAAGKILTSENGEENDLHSSIQTTNSKFSVNTLSSRFEKPLEMNVSGRSVSPTLAAGKIFTSENGKENDLNPSIQTKSSICFVHTLPSRFEKPLEMNVSGRSVSPTLAAGKILTSENGEENDLNPSIQTKSSICSVHTLPSRFEKPLEMNVSGRSVSPTLAAGEILTSENGEENDLNPSIQTKSSICSVHTLSSRFEKPLEMNVSGRSISPTIAAGKLLLENKGDLVNFPEQTNSSKVTKDIYSLDSEKNMQMDLLDKSVSPTMAAGKVLTLENERKDDHVNSSQVTAGAQKLPRATKRKRGMDITEETSSIMSIRNECSKNVHGETFKGKYDSHNQIDNFVRNICSNNSGTVEQSVNECNKQISEDLLECRLGNIESSHLLSEKVMKKNITSESVSPTVSGGKVSLDSNIKQNSMACEKLFLNCKVSSDLENSLQKDEGDGICSPTLALGRVFNATNRQLEKANFTEFQGQSILTSSETNNLSSKQKLWTTETISREEVLPDEVVGVNSRKDENTDSKLSLNLQSSALKDKQNNEFHCAANSSVSNFGNDFSESNFCISQNHASANPEATNGRVQDIPDNTLINNSEFTRLSPEQNVIDEVFHSRPSSNCRVMNLEKCSRVTEVNKRADNEQEMETTSDMSDFVPLNPSVTCERIDYDVKIDCNDVGNSDVPSPARYYKSSEVNITNGNVLIGTGKEKRHCEEELSNCTNWSENCDGYLGQEKKKYKTTNISPLPHFTKVPLINSPINYINLEKSIDVNYVMETDDEIDSEKNIPYTNTHSTSVSHLPLTDTDIGRNSVTSEKNSSESSNSLIDVSKLSENDGDISVMDCIRSMREKDLEDRENESRRSIVMSPSHNVSSANRKSFQANSFQKPEFKQSFHGSRKDTKEILVSPLPNKKLKYFGNANKGDVFDEINNENHEETQKSRSQINLFDTEIGHPYSQNNNSMELQESVFSSPTSRKCDNVVSSIALVEIKCDVAEENLNNLSTNLQTPSTDAYLESKKVLSPSSQIFNESKTSEEKLYGKTHTNEFPNNSTQNDHLGADLENARFSSPNLNSVCKSNMFSVSHEMVRETTEPITYVHQEIPARNIDEEKNNSLKYSNKSSVSSGTTLQNSVTTFSGSPCSVELWIEEHQKRFDCAWTFVSITNTTMNFYFIERQLHILINIDPCDCSINILTYSNISGNKMKLLMNVFMMRKLDPKYLELHFRKKNDIPSLITYVTQQIDFFFDFFQDWLHLLIQHNIQIDSNLRVTFKVFSLVLSWCCKVSVDFSDWDGGRRQMKHITVLREVGEASTDDIRKLIRGVPAGPHILKDYIKHIHDYINIKESLEGHVD